VNEAYRMNGNSEIIKIKIDRLNRGELDPVEEK
jgi:hypothetical protein